MNPLTRLARILLRIGAGLAVIAIIAGPIALMAAVAGNPLDPDIIGALGDRNIDTDHTIALLSIAFYALWAWFAIPAIRQATITLTTRPTTTQRTTTSRRSIRRAAVAMPADEPGPRGWLAGLVRFALGAATIATTLAPTTTVGWTPTVSAAPVTVIDETSPDDTPIAEREVDRTNAVSHTTAQRRDTPYAIARRLFPDNLDQARDAIVELNTGRPTPNGGTWIGGNFPAGMHVVTPYRTPEPTTTVGEAVSYTVQPNDGWINVIEALWGPDHTHRWNELRLHLIGQTVAPGTTITADTHVIHPGWTFTRPTDSNASTPSVTSRVVEAGDTLHDLIDDAIDEPVTRNHIAAVAHHNHGITTPDGTHAFDASNPDLIHPGQTFDLTPITNAPDDIDTGPEAPADPVGTAVNDEPDVDDTSSAPTDPAPTVDVAPAADTDAPTVEAPSDPLVDGPPIADGPSTPLPFPTNESAPIDTDAAPAPPVTRPAPPVPIPTNAHVAAAPQPGDVAATPPTIPAGPTTISTEDESNESTPFALLGAGGIALAGLFIALDRRRRRARTRRRTGTTIAAADPNQAAIEHAVRRSANIDRATRVNLAIRQLGTHLAQRDTPLRAHYLVANDTDVAITFQHPVDLDTDDWTPSNDHHTWTCTVRDDDLHNCADSPTPWPALLPIGTLDDGTDLLIDLEATGSLAIIGPETTSLAVIAATITALSASPYADLLTFVDTDHVDLHGLQHHLADRLTVDTADDLIDRLEQWTRPFDFTDLHLLSARHHMGGEYEPCIAALIGPLDDEQQERLDGLPLDGSHPIAVITTNPTTAHTILELDENAHVHIGGHRVRCHRLEAPAARATATLFDVVDTPTVIDTPPLDEYGRLTDSIPSLKAPEEAPGDTETTDVCEPSDDERPSPATEPANHGLPPLPAQLFDTEPDVDWTIRVLGPLEIIHTDGTHLNGPRVRELATLLAMHPNGLSSDRVKDMLGNHSTAITTRISELRKLLGRGDTAAGRTHLPANSGARGYHLEGVQVDSIRLARCLDHARTTTRSQDKINWLVGALELVRGPIGTGEVLTYEWASHLFNTLEATIVEAGVELAHLAADADQWAIVDWAANQTRLANPYEQRLLPLQIDARRHLGNDHTIRRLHDDALDHVDQFEPDVQAAFHTALAQQAR